MGFLLMSIAASNAHRHFRGFISSADLYSAASLISFYRIAAAITSASRMHYRRVNIYLLIFGPDVPPRQFRLLSRRSSHASLSRYAKAVASRDELLLGLLATPHGIYFAISFSNSSIRGC